MNPDTELQIFRLTNKGFKAIQNKSKHSQARQRPQTGFRLKQTSMTNLHTISNKAIKQDISESKFDETTKENTSWKNRSKTHRFSEPDIHSYHLDKDKDHHRIGLHDTNRSKYFRK